MYGEPSLRTGFVRQGQRQNQNKKALHPNLQPTYTFKRIKNSRPLQDEAAFNPICTSCFDALRI
jgi:hypothetical protein